MKRILLLVFTGIMSLPIIAQEKPHYDIGILIDVQTPETEQLFEMLKNEVTSVIGEDATVAFPEKNILVNNYNLEEANKQYQQLLNNETDLIIAFGFVNNQVVAFQESYAKPTILFGAINREMVPLKDNQTSSGINNFTFIVTSQSYEDDIATLKQLTNCKKVGIVVEKQLLGIAPIQKVFSELDAEMGITHQLMPYESTQDILQAIDQDSVDAVFFLSGFYLNQSEIEQLAKKLIEKRIPSFTSTSVEDVRSGLMATNQAAENLNQFFRRIALSVEAVVNGQNLAERPIFLQYSKQLTMNFNTMELVGVPIRYDLVSSTNFVGDFNNALSEKTYSLVDVMNEAIEKNLTLQSSQQDVTLADWEVKTARSDYLPDVSASATGTYVDPENAINGFGQNPEFSSSGNLSLTQVVYSPNVSANISIQKALQKAQQENFNTDKLDVIFDVVNAYFNALILKTNLQIQAQNLEVTKKNLNISEQNFDAGQTGKSDILRFRSEVAQNTQSLIEASNQLAQAYLALNQLLNNPINYEIDVASADLGTGVFEGYNYENLKTILDDPLNQKYFIEFLTEEAIRNSPELKSLNYNLEATNRSLRLFTTGRFLPTLALQGNYTRIFNRTGEGSEGFMGAELPNSNYNISGSLSIPIFNQNKQNLNRQIALIQQNQLSINRANLKLSIEQNVNAAVLNLINQIVNIELSEVSEQAAKESLELTQIAYSTGAVQIVQLLEIQNNYLQAQLARANAVYNFLLSAMSLERSLGFYFLLFTEEENQAFNERFDTFRANK
ncbi:MAG: TolC family protein [Bacteroidota bacterium]